MQAYIPPSVTSRKTIGSPSPGIGTGGRGVPIFHCLNLFLLDLRNSKAGVKECFFKCFA